jgi:hypothetical protein
MINDILRILDSSISYDGGTQYVTACPVGDIVVSGAASTNATKAKEMINPLRHLYHIEFIHGTTVLLACPFRG